MVTSSLYSQKKQKNRESVARQERAQQRTINAIPRDWLNGWMNENAMPIRSGLRPRTRLNGFPQPPSLKIRGPQKKLYFYTQATI